MLFTVKGLLSLSLIPYMSIIKLNFTDLFCICYHYGNVGIASAETRKQLGILSFNQMHLKVLGF